MGEQDHLTATPPRRLALGRFDDAATQTSSPVPGIDVEVLELARLAEDGTVDTSDEMSVRTQRSSEFART
jgi:hypothetical protein